MERRWNLSSTFFVYPTIVVLKYNDFYSNRLFCYTVLYIFSISQQFHATLFDQWTTVIPKWKKLLYSVSSIINGHWHHFEYGCEIADCVGKKKKTNEDNSAVPVLLNWNPIICSTPIKNIQCCGSTFLMHVVKKLEYLPFKKGKREGKKNKCWAVKCSHIPWLYNIYVLQSRVSRCWN
jgi:hypothetical protein